MRTRRIKLFDYEGVAFWLLLFQDEHRLMRYMSERGCDTPSDYADGSGCCCSDPDNKRILVMFGANNINQFVVPHEAFHAALAWSRMRRRRYTKPRWMKILIDQFVHNQDEEELAVVCGMVVDNVWAELYERFNVHVGDKSKKEASQ